MSLVDTFKSTNIDVVERTEILVASNTADKPDEYAVRLTMRADRFDAGVFLTVAKAEELAQALLAHAVRMREA